MEHKLSNIQIIYNNKFGRKDPFKLNICCFKVKTLTQLVPVLLLLDTTFFFIQTYFRWGAPCFLWWNNIFTAITFLTGHITRIMGIPVCIYSIIQVSKNKIDGSTILFNYLFLLLTVTLIDLGLCIFEVDYVCNSDSIKLWNQCSHEWGKEEFECLNQGQSCIAPLRYENMEDDKKICEDFSCDYVKKNILTTPECCNDSEWEYHNPCSEKPVIRPAVFDTSWCENFSDFYDIGIGILTSIMLFGFTYVVHSHNMILTEEIKFTNNPMEEYSEDGEDES